MWSIIVHGGAGAIDPTLSEVHQSGCRAAVDAGVDLLSAGGSALDAACAAVRVLEDNPVFNAGIGGTLDANGVVSHDAALFRASDLGYGAMAAVSGVRNPIELARAILNDGRHSILAGPGALAFARQAGVELCDPARHITDPSRSKWWFTEADARSVLDPPGPVGDTVGAVVRDRTGEIVAAPSPGGLLHKYPGRVGDSPIAGAGTYARADLGGLSATGHGETILRTVLAYEALCGLAMAPDAPSATAALDASLERARRAVGGRAGAIAVRSDGTPVWARNTPHMGVAWALEGDPVRSAF